MVEAIGRELDLRRSELSARPLATIYFGGGTPSLLSSKELDFLFEAIHRNAEVLPGAEITLEANPDDLDPPTIERLANSPVNRLSIGVQSFADEDLKYMGRVHNRAQAIRSLEDVRRAGFHNFSIDLIFGSPTTNDQIWADNLQLAIDCQAKHISAYALTIEEKTALEYQIRKGKSEAPSDERAEAQYFAMCDFFVAQGFDHYEIASFARPGHRSRHNSNYWSGRPYIGVGPSAHGFDGKNERRWNIANNLKYVNALSEMETYADYLQSDALYESEILQPADRYNETIMTRLRETAGVDLDQIGADYGQRFVDYFLAQMRDHLDSGRIIKREGKYALATHARFLADGIAADGFYIT